MGVQGSSAVFATHDTAEGRDVLQQVLGLRATPAQADGPFSLTLSWAGEGAVRYGRVRLGGPAALTAEHDPRVIRVGQVLDGVGGSTGTVGRLPRRGPFLFSPDLWPGPWQDLELLTVCLDAAAVEDHARQLLGSPSFCLRFTGTRPVNEAMARYWLGAVAHLHRDLWPNAQAMANPLLRAEGIRSLATALLHTFPSTFLTPPAPHETAPVPGALARAVAFIDAHLGEPIGVTEIAAAARMSPRGLQAAFRREKGTTPVAHLRAARLEAAHRDLVAADPTSGATVTAIADRWRLHHRGRFAAAYRNRYGQDPATTLRS